MLGSAFARVCTLLYWHDTGFWQSGFCAAAAFAPGATKQSQSLCSVQVFEGFSGKTHAYCSSAFGTGVAIDGFHSCPLNGSAFGALPGPAIPIRGVIDSIMCGSLGGMG